MKICKPHTNVFRRYSTIESGDKTLASPESIAYEKKVRAKIERDIATGNVKNYISGDNLEELF